MSAQQIENKCMVLIRSCEYATSYDLSNEGYVVILMVGIPDFAIELAQFKTLTLEQLQARIDKHCKKANA